MTRTLCGGGNDVKMAADDSNNITGEATRRTKEDRRGVYAERERKARYQQNVEPCRTGRQDWPTERGEEDRSGTTENQNSWTGRNNDPDRRIVYSANT